MHVVCSLIAAPAFLYMPNGSLSTLSSITLVETHLYRLRQICVSTRVYCLEICLLIIVITCHPVLFLSFDTAVFLRIGTGVLLPAASSPLLRHVPSHL